MSMLKVNLAEAKAKLSYYLEAVENGECVVICKRNVPVAEIRPLPRAAHKRRPVGLAKGTFSLSRRFFDPLPNELLAAFGGGSEAE